MDENAQRTYSASYASSGTTEGGHCVHGDTPPPFEPSDDAFAPAGPPLELSEAMGPSSQTWRRRSSQGVDGHVSGTRSNLSEHHADRRNRQLSALHLSSAAATTTITAAVCDAPPRLQAAVAAAAAAAAAAATAAPPLATPKSSSEATAATPKTHRSPADCPPLVQLLAADDEGPALHRLACSLRSTDSPVARPFAPYSTQSGSGGSGGSGGSALGHLLQRSLRGHAPAFNLPEVHVADRPPAAAAFHRSGSLQSGSISPTLRGLQAPAGLCPVQSSGLHGPHDMSPMDASMSDAATGALASRSFSRAFPPLPGCGLHGPPLSAARLPHSCSHNTLVSELSTSNMHFMLGGQAPLDALPTFGHVPAPRARSVGVADTSMRSTVPEGHIIVPRSDEPFGAESPTRRAYLHEAPAVLAASAHALAARAYAPPSVSAILGRHRDDCPLGPSAQWDPSGKMHGGPLHSDTSASSCSSGGAALASIVSGSRPVTTSAHYAPLKDSPRTTANSSALGSAAA